MTGERERDERRESDDESPGQMGRIECAGEMSRRRWWRYAV